MNDRFRFRIWNPDLQSYDDNRDYNVAILVNQDFGLVLNPYRDNIIEMCTGLKDKNGKLIYEGDLLTDGRDTGHVLWRGSGWGCTAFLWKKKPETLEICGNIHEQAEQKD